MKGPRLSPHLTICLIGFSFVASASVATPILSLYVRDALNAPVEVVGLVTSVFFIVSALTKMFSGIFTGGRRTISALPLAFLVYSVCPALIPWIGDVSVLVVLRSVQGLMVSFIGTTTLLFATLTTSSADRDRGLSTYTASLSLGLLAGPAITTLSIPLVGISNTFYFSSLIASLGFLGTLLLSRRVLSIDRDWQIIGVATEREPLALFSTSLFKYSLDLKNKTFLIDLIPIIWLNLRYNIRTKASPESNFFVCVIKI